MNKIIRLTKFYVMTPVCRQFVHKFYILKFTQRLQRSMKPHQVFATAMVAILVLGVMTAIGNYSFPIQQAAAANVTVTTSADAHNDTFFNGLLQVIIEDDSTDDAVNDTISVNVRIESPEGDAEQQITVINTHAGSQTFEFFVCPVTAACVPADPDTDFALTDDQVVLFGDGAGADELDMGVSGFDPTIDDATITIEYGNQADVLIDYDETNGILSSDRDDYGGDSVMHLFVTDQDGNIDPTVRDSFIATEGAELDQILTVDGAAFVDDITFTETSDNSAKFEAEIQLTTADTATANELDFTEDSVQATYNDLSDLATGGFVNPTASTATSSINIAIDDQDGVISTLGDITFGSELKVTVKDNDRNIDSEEEDTIPDGLFVSTDGGEDEEEYDLDETDDNTGIFAPDQSNDEIKINFCTDNDIEAETCPDRFNGILEFTKNTITEDVTMEYDDPLNDNDVPEAFTETFELALARPSIDLPETSGINDDFTVTITDANLNDNPRTKDTYTLKLSDEFEDNVLGAAFDLEEGAFPILKSGEQIGTLATIEVDIESRNAVFDCAPADLPTETLTETGVNSNIFVATFDMEEILDCTGADVDDGDSIEFTINDLFDDQSHEASDELSIGKATTGVDFSRTALPIPPEDDSSVADALGPSVFTTLTITDADQNTDSNTEETLDFNFKDDCGDGTTCPDEGIPSFTVEIDADGNNNDEEITCLDSGEDDECDDGSDYAGSLLEDIMPDLPALDETSKTSGIFDDDIEFFHGPLDNDEWQDLEITFTYIDADGDEESSGITFRGNDGVVTVDQDSVTNGAVMTITVQDEDLNLDDDTAEEFEGEIATDEPYLLAVETEDDDVCDDADACPTTETFRETGDDTGIYVATYRVGEDIPVTEQAEGDDTVTQATNILITYNDEVDGGGNSGDEIEVNVPVVTATGAILVEPELVGPGTEISVTITDSDLNKDPSGADDFDPQDVGVDPDSDDFFVNFRSDRNEVGEGSPEIEETGSNTGVFTFSITLETDENACEDDDLGDNKFDAQGGSEPSIGACPGDLISIRYEDEQDASGRGTVVSKVVEVKSYDPEFVADKDAYNVGDKVTVSIADPDANRDADISDSLRDVRVFSDTDQVGTELSALETGKNTGVFKLSFATSSTSQGGAIQVKAGDDVTLEYTDDFPADFEEEENDKDFTFSIPIGTGPGGQDSTVASPPQAQDVSGKPISEVKAGQQVVLTTTVINKNDQAQPFVALIEVRDSNDVTVYLAWQTGTLNPSGQANIGLSWTPDNSDSYTVRAFVISSLDKPTILSKVAQSPITVS